MKKIIGYLIIAAVFTAIPVLAIIYTGLTWQEASIAVGIAAAIIILIVVGVIMASGIMEDDNEPSTKDKIRAILQNRVHLAYNDCGNPYEVIMADPEDIDDIVEEIIKVEG